MELWCLTKPNITQEQLETQCVHMASRMSLLYERWIDQTLSRRKKDGADVDRAMRAGAEVACACRWLGRRPHEVSALDFGMGWGHWAGVARAFGLSVAGLEVSGERVASARARGVEAVGSLDELSGRRFEFIRANQVFEHLNAPLVALRALAGLAAPGGLVHVVVPDCTGALARVAEVEAGGGWSAAKDELHPLEHINYFTPGSLVSMAHRAGLERVTLSAPLMSCGVDIRAMLPSGAASVFFTPRAG